MKPFTLPKTLLMGSATSSLQIEGGDRGNNWYRWAASGNIQDGSTPIVACDHWNRWKEDVDLLAEMGHETYRLSIEWSRVEPAPGVIDSEVLERYAQEVQLLRDKGIDPLVTLHHFSEPIWFEDQGGWQKKSSVACFVRYVNHVVHYLSPWVNSWVTINEPNVYLTANHVVGNFPPGHRGMSRYFHGAANMIEAHVHAYQLIHEVGSLYWDKVQVGFALHMAYIEPAGFPSTHLGSMLMEHNFHTIFLEGMNRGILIFPLKQRPGVKPGIYADFMGINYYARYQVQPSWNPRTLFFKLGIKPSGRFNDLGWEIHPEGLHAIAKDLYAEYGLPIWITENGTCDHADAFRGRFIIEHLESVHRIIEEGIPVERYYHWSTLDNFEWDLGLIPRFGLVEVDYVTQERRIRPSGHMYSSIIRRREVTEAMIQRYIKSLNHYRKDPNDRIADPLRGQG